MAASKKSSKKKTPRKADPKQPASSRAAAAKKATKKAAKKATQRSATKKAAPGKPAKKAATKKPAQPVSKRAAAPKAKAAGAPKAASPTPRTAGGPPAVLPGPRPGEDAPDFKLLDDAGRTQSLGNFRGKKVVLYFYPKDFTGGCTQQACDFRDNLGRLAEKGAVVIGVSADSVDSHKRFKEKQGINFLLLSDPGHEAIGSYGVWQEKSLYGRKFMGIVRSTFLIDGQGKLVKSFPKVKVGGHVDEVLAAL